MSEAAIALLAKILIAGGALGFAFGAWKWHGHTEYQRGRADMAAEVNKVGEKKVAANVVLEAARNAVDAKGELTYLERMKALETRDAEEHARSAALRDRVARLQRAGAGSDARRPDPGDTCRAEFRDYSERIEGLLRQAESVGLRSATLVVGLRDLAGEGESGLARAAAVIGRCQDYARAVKLETPAPDSAAAAPAAPPAAAPPAALPTP